MTDSTMTVKTTCPYCGVGCGVLVTPGADGSVAVKGDPSHPANLGRLCSKGAALGETVGIESRLMQPRLLGLGQDGDTSWETALDTVAEGFSNVIAEHGPEAVAFYVSGQLLTEDYYVANKLMKGFIGSANIDTNSRLCMSSSVVGHKRAFGADAVPGCYEDLELADLIVLVGSNMAWCHPVLFRRIEAAKAERPDLKVVVIDPRRTDSCDLADLHLAIQPGSDVHFYNGLLAHLSREDKADWEFLEAHTAGFSAAVSAARESSGSIPETAMACGLEADAVSNFFNLFARTEKVVTVYSQGVNQSSSGSDKVNAIINAHLFTGRIGQPGMGPFSVTGQPNAMGGREVGGLANQLAAHMDIADPVDRDRVQRFWQSPVMAEQAGYMAVELFEAVAAGKIKAIWIMATNPVVSMPNADIVRDALQACPLVVVSDITETDTSRCANVFFPATGWGEKDGTVTNSERCISRQRAFLSSPGAARHDWQIICQVAQKMGFGKAFSYQSAQQIFTEHAALSAFENDGQRGFDLSELSGLDAEAYRQLEPIQWPVNPDHPHGRVRLFENGRFFTGDGKARLLALQPRLPVNSPAVDYPLILNTGRIRDQWHTMTRTGLAPKLGGHIVEPYVEIHPADAAKYQLQQGELARLSSRWGQMLARVEVSKRARPGSVFVPIHWSDEFASMGRVDALVNPVVDPISGEPEFKHTPVRIETYQAIWQGFVLTRKKLTTMPVDYFVRSMGQDYHRYEVASEVMPDDWQVMVQSWLTPEQQDDVVEYQDATLGRYRMAILRDGKLQSCAFFAVDGVLPSRSWLADLFAEEEVDQTNRMSLLAGRAPGHQIDSGRKVCACFNVGINTLREAIVGQQLTTPEEVGVALQAGTNCGSCVPEIKTVIAEVQAQA